MRQRRESATAYALLAPATLLLGIFVILPGVLALAASLFDVDIFSVSNWEWVGLDNFTGILSDPDVRRAIANTLLYCVILIIPSMVLGLAQALLASSLGRGRAVIQTLLFLPFAANMVAMSVVFRYIYEFREGFLDQLLAVVGIAPVNFLGSTALALPTVATVGMWRAVSLATIMYLAGLTSIPTAVHDACQADGIVGWAKLRHVTWPLLKPITVLVTVLMVMQAVQVFDTIRVLTDGGPQSSSETVLTMTWRLGFVYFDLGQGAALSALVVIVLIGVGLVRRQALRGDTRPDGARS